MRPPFSGLRSGYASPVVLGRKFCSRCGRWRLLTDYSVRPDGRLRAWCETCQRDSNRAAVARRTEQQRTHRREYERIWRETKRRQAGVPVRPLTRAMPVERVFLPAAPLVAEMDRFVRKHPAADSGYDLGGGWDGLAALVGTDARSLLRLRTGESAHVRVDFADRIAVAIDMPLSLIYDET